ncbi:DUF1254 domain-containing protein [Phenylobacterium sp.]|uniref:DUF1254 domain-containing protein n=1 Tax=Phenylobacterium sp. TaxID=1871053 RepID=UPI0025F44C54|nr:DUF1254 domain-containing protein [Phenylobacterium sp.]MCA3721100.1 DUF1254 domain-containing protein [Phenylobacterium sp.]
MSDLEALRDAARAAYVFTLPLIEIATTRSRGLAVGSPMNSFGHMRNLADHTARKVTTPNNDTFYSTAQVDLSAGPVTLTLPPSGDRYLSVQFMDAYSNTFALLGTRTTGGDGGTYTLVGPGDAAEPGPRVLRSPSRHVWVLARILVTGPEDAPAAKAVQTGLSMQGPAVPDPGAFASRGADWKAYLASAAELMRQNPPPATDGQMLRRMAPLGLEAFDPERFTTAEAEAIAEGLEQGRRFGRGAGGLTGSSFIDGWSYPDARLGNFGQNYALRAAVAVGGLAALPPEEAMYMRAEGELPRALFDGARAWRLHIPADRQIPVDSFWSLSLYEATEDGQFFFTRNDLNRFAIGDRTPGLAYNPDGSLDIWIGAASPGTERESNWLPAPQGPFALFMRAYLPRPELLDGRWRLPPVTPA